MFETIRLRLIVKSSDFIDYNNKLCKHIYTRLYADSLVEV